MQLCSAGYLFGVIGRVREVVGYLEEPDISAYPNADGPKQPVYRVVFSQKDVWESYSGPEEDTIDIEIWQTPLASYTRIQQCSRSIESLENKSKAHVSQCRAAHVQRRLHLLGMQSLPTEHVASSQKSAQGWQQSESNSDLAGSPGWKPATHLAFSTSRRTAPKQKPASCSSLKLIPRRTATSIKRIATSMTMCMRRGLRWSRQL